MSTQSAPDHQSTRALVHRAGIVCLWGGLLGAASGIALAVFPPVVAPDIYSYPLSASTYAVAQVFFFVQHLALALGLYGLWRSGVAGRGRAGRWGIAIAIAGMLLLAVIELAAISIANASYPGPRTDPFDVYYGISTLTIGAGLVLAGIAVLRAGIWKGWERALPLLLGIYVFVPMTPAIMGPFILARLAITGWMLLFALLGWALMREVEELGDRA